MIAAAEELAPVLGTRSACRVTGACHATVYRRRRVTKPAATKERAASPRALTPQERSEVLDVLHSERFFDVSVAEVVATLLDEETYLCSIRTMYRILEDEGESRERRAQLHHPNHVRPELLATAPNELWSWDITKLLGPAKWTYYYLYVILDVFSRYVVGWMLAHRESAALAKRLIAETCAKQEIARDRLTVHADRGSSMTSKPVALLLADLGVTKTHSRPHVSNDNPYSEAQFKTMKYRPEFPGRFGSIEDARAFCQTFFGWYNAEHRHSGIALMTPEVVHYGRAKDIQKVRTRALLGAYAEHPERSVKGAPRPWPLQTAAWINRPEIRTTTKEVTRDESLISQGRVSQRG